MSDVNVASMSIEEAESLLRQQFPRLPDAQPFTPDEAATWVYWTDADTAERGVLTDWVWERLRLRRNALLSGCDFRVVVDAPWDTAPWLAYRQALRDLPHNTTDPRQAMWPEPPE